MDEHTGTPLPLGLTRRRLAQGAAWTVPTVMLFSPAPASASSLDCALTLVTSGLSASGVDLYLRDTKATNSNTNTSGTTQTVVNLSVKFTCGGVGVAGVQIDFVGDQQKDGEGNYMIGASPATQTTNFGESPTQRTASVTTDATGVATAKISTATYSSADCVSRVVQIKSGTMTIKASDASRTIATLTLTYTVYDGAATVTCP